MTLFHILVVAPQIQGRMITGENTMYKQIKKWIPAGILLATLFCARAGAQDKEADVTEEEPVYDENTAECISLRHVRRTKVVDDRNVLFYMSGKTVYHNVLPRSCSGLAREDRFSYQTSIGRLCRLDQISVLYNDPFGMRAGNRCSLGAFQKIDRDDAKAFMDSTNNDVPAAKPLPMPAPQEVGASQEQDPEES